MAINIKLDLKKIPKSLRIVISLLPPVIILVLTLFLVVMPKTKAIKQLNIDISKQQDEIAKSEAMVAKLDLLKTENEKLKMRLAELQEQLPEEKEVSSLLKQISEVAAKSDVDIISWKPEAKKAHPSGIIEEIPFSLNLIGNYHSLGYFFSNLTKLNRIVNLADIKLDGPKLQKGETILNIGFKASTFSAIKVDEKASDMGGKAGK